MDGKELTALTDVETLEVSLVKRGANRKRIAIAKTEETNVSDEKQLDAIVKAAIDVPLENESQIDEIIKAEGLSPKAARAVKTALRSLGAFKDEIPKSKRILSALSDMIGAEEEEEEEEVEKKAKVKKAEEDSAAVVELQTKLDTLWKTSEEQKEAIVKAEARAVEAEAKLVELQKSAQEAADQAEYKALVEHCAKAFPFVANSAEDKAKTLKALSPELRAQIEATWKQANDQLASSGIFKSIGTEAAPAQPSGAKEKLEAKIAEIRKVDPKLSHAQAYVKVIKADPALRTELMSASEEN